MANHALEDSERTVVKGSKRIGRADPQEKFEVRVGLQVVWNDGDRNGATGGGLSKTLPPQPGKRVSRCRTRPAELRHNLRNL
jgi:hypothetical protein